MALAESTEGLRRTSTPKVRVLAEKVFGMLIEEEAEGVRIHLGWNLSDHF